MYIISVPVSKKNYITVVKDSRFMFRETIAVYY